MWVVISSSRLGLMGEVVSAVAAGWESFEHFERADYEYSCGGAGRSY